jgi:hypothetical protein
MEIKIPEDICKQALADLELSGALRKQAQDAMQSAQSLFDQAKGVELSVQARMYRALDLQPVAGDVMQFAEGILVRKDPEPVKVPDPPKDQAPGEPTNKGESET